VKIFLSRHDGLDDDFVELATDRGHDVRRVEVTETIYRERAEVAAELHDLVAATIIVTSRRAAPYVDLVTRHDACVLACVGPTTRSAVSWEGPALVAEPANAATLGTLVSASPIVWLAGVQRRPDLSDVLRARGLSCHIVEVYDTHARALSETEQHEVETADLVICAAPSSWVAIAPFVRTSATVVSLRASSVPRDVTNRRVVGSLSELVADL
jgi:uroporphyrinogen-III synthase